MILFLFTMYDGPWKIRIDSPHGNKEYHQKHIHLSRKGLNGKYSWNIDGSRHDGHKFPYSEIWIEQAKNIVSKKLNIDRNILQFISTVTGKSKIVLKNNQKKIFGSYYVKKKNQFLILIYDDTLLMLEMISDE